MRKRDIVLAVAGRFDMVKFHTGNLISYIVLILSIYILLTSTPQTLKYTVTGIIGMVTILQILYRMYVSLRLEYLILKEEIKVSKLEKV